MPPRTDLVYDSADRATPTEVAILFGAEAQGASFPLCIIRADGERVWSRVHGLVLAHEHFLDTGMLLNALIAQYARRDRLR